VNDNSRFQPVFKGTCEARLLIYLDIQSVVIFQVLQLKIANNPFARAFRMDGGNSLRKNFLRTILKCHHHHKGSDL